MPPRPLTRQRHKNPYPVDATTNLTPPTPQRPRKYPAIPYNANIIGSFPNTTIYLIISLPPFKTLNSIHLKLNQNTASFDSKPGDEINGLLPLTVSTAVYNILSTTPFIVHTNLGPHATGNGTAIQIAAFV